ncbi:MAG: hypothetical protein LBN24_08290 [Mediterranea sp.]|nr:hypothetical protein [Mediterranea sp.]
MKRNACFALCMALVLLVALTSVRSRLNESLSLYNMALDNIEALALLEVDGLTRGYASVTRRDYLGSTYYGTNWGGGSYDYYSAPYKCCVSASTMEYCNLSMADPRCHK